MSPIQTIDRIISSNTKISNEILVGGTKVFPIANPIVPATSGSNNITIKTNLQNNFGSCGWSNQSNNNPIPFTLNTNISICVSSINNLQISRYPKKDWIYNASPIGNKINYASTDINAQLDKNVHIQLYPNAYADFQCPITYKPGLISLSDSVHDITPPYAMEKGKLKFQLKNVSSLNIGEYRYDYANDKIIINAPIKDQLYVSTGKASILILNKVSNCVFTNVTFAGGVDGINITDCKNIQFINCKFINIPKTALNIKTSSNIIIQGCTFANIGFGAITMQACGNYMNLDSANIKIKDCIFKNCNKTKYTNAPIINTNNGVGLIITNCAFYNATAAAINSKSNNTIIFQCYFENCCSQTSDYGVIYVGRTLTRRGLIIGDCYFKKLIKASSFPKYSIYCDDGYSGAHVFNCIFENVDIRNYCFFSFGQDHVIENCTFINVNGSVKIPSPRMPHSSCIVEYNALMANTNQKKIFVKAYPPLATPIDLSKKYIIPTLTLKNCNFCFDNPVNKSISSYLSIAKESKFIHSGSKILATSRHLPNNSSLSIPIVNINF